MERTFTDVDGLSSAQRSVINQAHLLFSCCSLKGHSSIIRTDSDAEAPQAVEAHNPQFCMVIATLCYSMISLAR